MIEKMTEKIKEKKANKKEKKEIRIRSRLNNKNASVQRIRHLRNTFLLFFSLLLFLWVRRGKRKMTRQDVKKKKRKWSPCLCLVVCVRTCVYVRNKEEIYVRACE